MKKIKLLLIFMLAVLVACLSLIQTAAVTIYQVNGFSYTVVDTYTISLCGWDNRSPELVIPDSIAERNVGYISNYGFQNNTEITSVDFSQAKHIDKIGRYAFSGCKGISNEVVLPETLTYIFDGAFSGCLSLPAVTIKGSISEIPYGCFQNCETLSYVQIPDTVETIGHFAFDGCSNLLYLELPYNVNSIGYKALPSNNLTLGVWYGSYGYEYAIENSIDYILLDGAKLGDANGDGSVNINDVTAIQRFKADMEVIEGINLHAADVNGDGNVTIEDATILQRYFAEYDDIPYSIGEVMTQ